MSKEFEIISRSIPSQEEANKLMEKLIAAGHADAVFSPPVENGQYKVITVAETRVGLGFGFGGGAGGDDESQEEGAPDRPSYGGGGGGGGGGASMARPVAIVELGPNGARVEPIVDPTKIALAFFSTLITIFSLGARLRRDARL